MLVIANLQHTNDMSPSTVMSKVPYKALSVSYYLLREAAKPCIATHKSAFGKFARNPGQKRSYNYLQGKCSYY